jgi:hypothetical protein
MNLISDNLYHIKYVDPNLDSKIFLRFNFLENNGVNIKNVGTGSGVVSGEIVPLPYNFWQTSGKGFFSGNYIKLKNIKNYIDFKNCSFIFNYEKLKNGSYTFISNVCTGNITQYNADGSTYQLNVKQGFEVGLTANNNLYFEYFTPSGPKVFTHNADLSDNSSVFLNFSQNSLGFGNFNFVTNSCNFTNIAIDSNYLYNPNNLYIGYNPESYNFYNNNQPFFGNLNSFIITSKRLFENEIKNIHTGYVYDTYASGTNEVTSQIFTGVTGYRYGVTGTKLVITGYQKTATGVIYDPWGFQNIGYSTSPLYGYQDLFGEIKLTGEYVLYSSGNSKLFLVKNQNSYYNYNKQIIKFTSQKTNEDLIDICLITGNLNQINKKNLLLNKNRLDYRFYVQNQIFDEVSPISVFVNGQLQTSGQIINLDNQYDSDLSRIIEDDYGIYNGGVVFYNIYDQYSDSIFLDINSGQTDCIKNFSITGGTRSFSSIFNKNIFFNGQKLVSGIHFVETNPGIITISGTNFIFTGTSGNLCFVPKNYDYFNTMSGSSIFNSNAKFFQNSSEIYINGIRQTNIDDYIELSKFNLKTGILFLEELPDLLYNK